MEIDPQTITAERDRTLHRMVEYFLEREGTRALFVSGSIAAGTADAYSDIDFRVVVEPERHEQFLAERATAPANWGDLLFNQSSPGSIHSVSHFRPFVKVDTFYYRPDHLQPSPWYTLPLRILYDPEQLVRRVIEASQELRFATSGGEVEASIDFGLAALHETFRRVNRGELVYAAKNLDELRLAIISAEETLREQPRCGFSHFETRAEPELVKTIHSSFCALEREAVRRTLLQLAGVYRAQVVCLHQRFPLARDLRNDVDSIDIVLGFLHPAGRTERS